MRSSALRVEFVVSGSAFLLAAYAAWLAGRGLFQPSYSTLTVEGWLGVDPLGSTGVGLLLTAVFLGAAFAVGALIVQLTFEIPGRRIVWNAQRQVLEQLDRTATRNSGTSDGHRELWRLATVAADLNRPANSGLVHVLKELLRPWPQGSWAKIKAKARTKAQQDALEAAMAQTCATAQTEAEATAEAEAQTKAEAEAVTEAKADAMAVLATAGWLRMTSEAAREVEYRRSNRQIFLGLLPAVSVGVIAAFMALLRGSTLLYTPFHLVSTFAVHSPAASHACWTCAISGVVGRRRRSG